MTPPTVAEFLIDVNEDAAIDVDFLALRAEVSCRGFSGQTAFTMARRDINRFVADAVSLSSNAADSALLLGGFEKAEQPLRFQLTRAGLSGQFTARVRVATSGPRSDQWNRVETEFVTAPEALAAFLDGLRNLANGDASAATLAGDSDAVA
jgi:hypothetical protein